MQRPDQFPMLLEVLVKPVRLMDGFFEKDLCQAVCLQSRLVFFDVLPGQCNLLMCLCGPKYLIRTPATSIRAMIKYLRIYALVTSCAETFPLASRAVKPSTLSMSRIVLATARSPLMLPRYGSMSFCRISHFSRTTSCHGRVAIAADYYHRSRRLQQATIPVQLRW